MTTMRWCSDCGSDEVFEQPEGLDRPEAFCVSCGGAVFLWVESATVWPVTVLAAYPAASRMTPTSVVATPAA